MAATTVKIPVVAASSGFGGAGSGSFGAAGLPFAGNFGGLGAGSNFGGYDAGFGGRFGGNEGFGGYGAGANFGGYGAGFPGSFGGYGAGANFGGYGAGFPGNFGSFGGYGAGSGFGSFGAGANFGGAGFPGSFGGYGAGANFGGYGAGFPGSFGSFGAGANFGGYGAGFPGSFGGFGAGANFGGYGAGFGGLDAFQRSKDLERGYSSELNLYPTRPANYLEQYSLTNPLRIDAEGNRWLNYFFDLRGYKPEEINVTLSSKDRNINVEAAHEVKAKEHHVKRQYSRKAYISDDIKVDLTKTELKSYLTNEGLLVVEAVLPKVSLEEARAGAWRYAGAPIAQAGTYYNVATKLI